MYSLSQSQASLQLGDSFHLLLTAEGEAVAAPIAACRLRSFVLDPCSLQCLLSLGWCSGWVIW